MGTTSSLLRNDQFPTSEQTVPNLGTSGKQFLDYKEMYYLSILEVHLLVTAKLDG